MTTPLPELREADAPPDIAAIYQDIRRVTGLAQVNLIHRHLATRPGMLPWVWTALRPLYAAPAFTEAAERLAHSVERPGVSPLQNLLASEERDTVRRVLAAYNSGNAQNLIGLTVLARLLADHLAMTADGATSGHSLALGQSRDLAHDPARSDPARSDPGPSNPALAPARDQPGEASAPNASAGDRNGEDDKVPFPPLPRRETLSPEVRALVEKMAARHTKSAGVIPSMYLHLALWPEVLQPVNTFLMPILEGPVWSMRVGRVARLAGEMATDLSKALATGSAIGSASDTATAAGWPSIAEPGAAASGMAEPVVPAVADEPAVPAVADVPAVPAVADVADVAQTLETFVGGTIPEMIVVGRLLVLD